MKEAGAGRLPNLAGRELRRVPFDLRFADCHNAHANTNSHIHFCEDAEQHVAEQRESHDHAG
jgi:hypothetical protein